MLLVVSEQRLPEVEHRDHSLVGDPVEHRALLTPRLDEATPAQAGEMIRDLRLRHTKTCDELADRQLALTAQQLEDPQPDRITQPAEVLRHQVARQRRGRKTERGRADDAAHERDLYQKVLIHPPRTSSPGRLRRPTR